MSTTSRTTRSKPKVSDLDVIEERMGRLASLLADVADALSDYPEALRLSGDPTSSAPYREPGEAIRLRAAEWPTFEELQALLAKWRMERAKTGSALSTVPVIHRARERV